MTSIKIGELTSSFIAEIDTDEMSSIEGGANNFSIGLPSDLVTKLPELEAISVLPITTDVFDSINSLSFREIQNLSNFAGVVPGNQSSTSNSRTLPKVEGGFFLL